MDVAFHNAQISTVHGVILYPILDGIARCVCLGSWAVIRVTKPNVNSARATISAGCDVDGSYFPHFGAWCGSRAAGLLLK